MLIENRDVVLVPVTKMAECILGLESRTEAARLVNIHDVVMLHAKCLKTAQKNISRA
jgi:hypothetical protein